MMESDQVNIPVEQMKQEPFEPSAHQVPSSFFSQHQGKIKYGLMIGSFILMTIWLLVLTIVITGSEDATPLVALQLILNETSLPHNITPTPVYRFQPEIVPDSFG